MNHHHSPGEWPALEDERLKGIAKTMRDALVERLKKRGPPGEGEEVEKLDLVGAHLEGADLDEARLSKLDKDLSSMHKAAVRRLQDRVGRAADLTKAQPETSSNP